jgi:hypothetical protein
VISFCSWSNDELLTKASQGGCTQTIGRRGCTGRYRRGSSDDKSILTEFLKSQHLQSQHSKDQRFNEPLYLPLLLSPGPDDEKISVSRVQVAFESFGLRRQIPQDGPKRGIGRH